MKLIDMIKRLFSCNTVIETIEINPDTFVEETVNVQEPITVVGEVVETQAVVETSTESVLLKEDLKDTTEKPVKKPRKPRKKTNDGNNNSKPKRQYKPRKKTDK